MALSMKIAAVAALASTAYAFPHLMTEKLVKKALSNDPLAGAFAARPRVS